MPLLLPILIASSAVLAIWLFARGLSRQQAARRIGEATSGPVIEARRRDSWLTNWLSRAGYRGPAAASQFLAATVAGVAFGLVSLWVLNRAQLTDWLEGASASLPGTIGDAAQGVLSLTPWIILLNASLAPWMIVRAARRSRVASIERDLTITLELLATLAEAGLGFDSALARVQESATGESPLGQELEIYQRDVLAGVPRLQAFRHLADRVDVTTVSVFVSALSQAEQIGASLSETLRLQANDLRDRRKMQALIQAQALPVKLVFPLIICFLPGLFVSTLGPALYQLIKVVDGALRNAR
ncbi:MAG: type II secretion system F family protein [Bryobacteraceae bacterium]